MFIVGLISGFVIAVLLLQATVSASLRDKIRW